MSYHKVLILDKEIEVDVVYFYAGCEAKIHALPEDCYPEESAEVDWAYRDTVSEFTQTAIENNQEWQDWIEEQLIEALTEGEE